LENLLSEETIKRLILSLKSRKAWRLMDPIEVARNLKILCEHMPQEEVASKLGISNKGTIWVFLRLLDLPEKVQEYVRTGKIGKDTAYRVSLLKDKREQEILADAVLKYNLSSLEVRGIAQSLKKRNPDLPIEECIRLTLRARPGVEEEHIIVTKIQNDTLEALEKKSKENGVPVETLVRKSMSEALPRVSIASLKLVGTTAVMSLGKEDFQLFKKKAEEKKIKLEDLVETLINKWMLHGC